MQGRALGCRRVLLVADSLDIGGAERHVAILARLLRHRGHEVSIACASGGTLAADLPASGVSVHALGEGRIKRRADASYRTWLRRLVVRLAPDIVHAHMHASAVATAAAIEDLSVPLVITEHSEATWRDAGAWNDIARACRRAQAVIGVSQRIADQLLERTRLEPERVHVIHNSVPLPQQWRRIMMRRHFRTRNVVGVVARLLPEKGVDVFLHAAARVVEELPDSCFAIVGDGPERRRLEEVADELGIRARVGFLGERCDAALIMRRFDVLCVPSRSEGTPLVVLEAMASGTPMVATCAGGIPEQLRDGHEALLVVPGDSDALAAATVRLLRHRLLAMRLSRAARRRAQRLFGPERMITSLERVYAECLQPAVASADPAHPLRVAVSA